MFPQIYLPMSPRVLFVVEVMILNPLVDLEQLHPFLLCVVDSFEY